MKAMNFQLPIVQSDAEVERVVSALRAIPGVHQVIGSRPTKIFAVTWNAPATWKTIENTLTEMSYTVKWK